MAAFESVVALAAFEPVISCQSEKAVRVRRADECVVEGSGLESYYATQPGNAVLRDEVPLPVNRTEFSNGELAIALLCLYPPASLLRRRMGACVLSASDVEVREVAALAQSEQCADLVRYIADCGHSIEPDHAFWKSLQLALAGVTYEATTMPHPTRFIEMTGINRGSTAIQKRWVRPIATLAPA